MSTTTQRTADPTPPTDDHPRPEAGRPPRRNRNLAMAAISISIGVGALVTYASDQTSDASGGQPHRVLAPAPACGTIDEPVFRCSVASPDAAEHWAAADRRVERAGVSADAAERHATPVETGGPTTAGNRAALAAQAARYVDIQLDRAAEASQSDG